MGLYHPLEDEYYAHPYIDAEEWRDKPVRHYYVHGGFRGTEEEGKEARFCLYFPEKEQYEGRFFQYLSPAPEGENECEFKTGEEDIISFALTHGAYLVVSNQGGFVMNMGKRLYRTSANTAEFSRRVARKVYGYEHRPYGYVFGGSGGSFKTISCMEMTEGVWDGAVPYVIANPMATPNVYCPRVRVMRVLGEEGLARIVDNMEPGGSGDLYDGLTGEQKEVLAEATRMGFPKRAWFEYPYMGDGALMVLAPYVYAVYPQYFQDFWTKEGYEGSRPDSTEAKARLQFVTTVRELILEEKAETDEHFNNVDNSWQNTLIGNQNTPLIVLAQTPPVDAYLYHCRIRVLSGDAQGKESPIDTIENGTVKVSSAYDGSNGKDALEGLKVGDQVMIDNSDALAMQTLQRHQVPDETYHVYDQYRGEDGKPLYPQLPVLIGPVIAESGGGSVPCGDIHGKVIAVCSLLDESALPWHGDWYREAVRRHKGDETENCFRLYYNDNCIHGDIAEMGDDVDHVVDYLGVLHQSLMDVAAWCEKGIAPVPDTVYTLEDGQLTVPFDADDRGGLQPVVHAYVRSAGPGRADAQSTAWGKCVRVLAGDIVEFEAQINVPGETGIVTEAAWDYEKTGNYTQAVLERSDGGKKAIVHTTHVFHTPGTWFPTVKIKSNRYGDAEDLYIQCKNLDRVRVIVE